MKARGWELSLALLLAVLVDALLGSALNMGRLDFMGDIQASLDEFNMLEICYLGARLSCFLLAPWLLSNVRPLVCLKFTLLLLILTAMLMTLQPALSWLYLLRLIQGAAGGLLLVNAQSMLFRHCLRQHQPSLQAIFACGAVVAPATFIGGGQGWVIDSLSWHWLFIAAVPLALMALLTLELLPTTANGGRKTRRRHTPGDFPSLLLAPLAMFPLMYVLQQGNRWNWFDSAHIGPLLLLGSLSLLGFFVRQQRLVTPMLSLSVFQYRDFAFGLGVSLIAGAALFGSASLISGFSIGVLGLTATEAGGMLVQSGFAFLFTLGVAAFVIQARGASPISTIPFGLLGFMLAMWLLANSGPQSGIADMLPAVLLRGFAMGCLFLSLTLIALSSLPKARITQGVALFNCSRQLGGLVAIAVLNRLLEVKTKASATALSAHVTSGSAPLAKQQLAAMGQLTAEGMEGIYAQQLTQVQLAGTLWHQAKIIAFNQGFTALVIMFLCALPLVVLFKLGLKRSPSLR
ncbi:MFS transporter [Shewanella algae]|uniref:MFS transporter n=1 Tax=Shewanella algae TaxID=38313 RepID=UPI001AAE7147|nr:MFS transporter [Shewanella algae]MBO2622384.1 MFS transporter [Shewanella algae]